MGRVGRIGFGICTAYFGVVCVVCMVGALTAPAWLIGIVLKLITHSN